MRHWFSDATAFRRDPLGFLESRGANSGVEAFQRLHLGPRPIYLLTDPSCVKPLLKLDETVSNKGWLIEKLRPIIGGSSLLLSGDAHRRRRGAAHRHLARGTVEKLAPKMAAEIRRCAMQQARAGAFDAHRLMAPLALRMMSIGLFGDQVLRDGDELALVGAVNAVEDDIAESIFRALPLMPWSWLVRARRRRHSKRVMAFVIGRLRHRAASSSALRSLEELDLSDADLNDELLMLLLAGHHTTGSTAAWLLYHLATEPGLQDQIADEASRAADANGEVAVERLKDLPISQALVREVLRLYPAAWWFSREIRQTAVLADRPIPRGASVIVSPWQLHRDPRFWDGPETFRLDRDYGTPAYIPFGAGPRACVGMGLAMLELQLVALTFASAYRLTVLNTVAPARPIPKVTLIPPTIEIGLAVRDANPRIERERLIA